MSIILVEGKNFYYKESIKHGSFYHKDFHFSFGSDTLGSNVEYSKSINQLLEKGLCIYCKSKMYYINRGQYVANTSPWFGYSLSICNSCGWWRFESEKRSMGFDWVLYEAIERKFDIADPQIPLKLLWQHIAKHNEDIRYVNPSRFEQLITDLFRDVFQCEVKHCGRSRDGGIDLFAIISDQPVAVQVKRRSSSKPSESVNVVREFIGTMILNKIKRGMIVTTADSFSKPAKDAARNFPLMLEGNLIELISFPDLKDIFKLRSKIHNNFDSPLNEVIVNSEIRDLLTAILEKE